MNAALSALVGPLAPAVEGDGWVVGGGLRDALLGRPVADVDVAIAGPAEGMAGRLARAHRAQRFRLSERFGAWRVQGGGLPFTVDITPLQGGSLDEDLGRRDLTVNALALPLDGGGEVVDLHGGLDDLSARQLRLVGASALRDDPVRLLRVGRLAAQLSFSVDAHTAAQVCADAPLLTGAVPERVMNEVRRLLAQPGTASGLELLDELRVLGVLVPELGEARGLEQSPYHHKDVLAHTLEVVRHCESLVSDPEPAFRLLAPRVAARLAAPLADELTRGRALLLSALLHDMAKPATRAVTAEGRITFMGHDRLGAEQADAWCRRYRTSTHLREFVCRGVLDHLTLGFLVHRTPLSLRQIDRYLRRTEPDEVEIVLLSVADRLATRGPRTRESAIQRHLALAREVLRVHFELVDRGPIRPAMDGAALARALGLPAGPWTGELLLALREEQLVGAVGSPAEALRFARRWITERDD